MTYEERAVELEKDITLAQANAPTAETLAKLAKLSEVAMATGLIWKPDQDFLKKITAKVTPVLS